MKPELAAVATALIWGLWCVAEGKASKIQGIYSSSLLLSIAGLVISIIEIPAFYLLIKKSGEELVVSKQSLAWSFVTMASLSVASIPYLYATRHGKFITTLSITSAYPLAALVIGSVMFGEAIRARQLAGMLMIVIGTIIVNKD